MPKQIQKKKRKKRRRFLLILLVMILFFAAMLAVGLKKNRPDSSLEREQAAAQQDSLMRQAAEQKETENDPKTKNDPTEEWNLILVNPWHMLPDDYTPELADLPGGHQIDVRCEKQLVRMLNDCRASGLSPLICSSYRTMDYQVNLYEKEAERLHGSGMSWDDAYKLASESIAYPGTSEHQLGLSLDIVDEDYQLLDSSQEKTGVQKWLMENSWKYGFILRYPTAKSALTGIKYEPWHYRYVGKEAAKEIYDKGICLEEYLDQKRSSYNTGSD